VLFAQMPEGVIVPGPAQVDRIALPWLPPPDGKACLVVDLPGSEGVLLGLALAAHGYRPVPVLNVCTGMREVLDMRSTLDALQVGAAFLQALRLPDDAPPAFLLDSRRRGAGLTQQPGPGEFDNRWQVFPQDFPPAEQLLTSGLSSALLVQEGGGPQEDLVHVLRRWQDAGLVLMQVSPGADAQPQPLEVARPNWYMSVWYRLLSLMGLRRNEIGGFGNVIPRPGSGG
jgi:hypothetical protein